MKHYQVTAPAVWVLLEANLWWTGRVWIPTSGVSRVHQGLVEIQLKPSGFANSLNLCMQAHGSLALNQAFQCQLCLSSAGLDPCSYKSQPHLLAAQGSISYKGFLQWRHFPMSAQVRGINQDPLDI